MNVALRFQLLVMIALLASCAESRDQEEGKANSGRELVVAETRSFVLTAEELDKEVLALPPDQRLEPDADRAQWYGALARRMVVHRLLLEEARSAGVVQDPEFQILARRVERIAVSDSYLNSLPPGEPIEEEDVQAAFEEKREVLETEEKRLLLHIYKRLGADRNREQVVAELEELRARALAGESFQLLAEEYSESETRHDGGLVGEVSRGRFTPDFDRIVFALEEGVPSEPIVTEDGAHLFLVQAVLEERRLDYDEVRHWVLRELLAERRMERFQTAAEGLGLPKDSLVLDREEIHQVQRQGDPQALLLRVGDFSLTAGQFHQIFHEHRKLLGAKFVPDLFFRLLEEIRDREIIYQYLRREDQIDIPREELQRRLDKELVDYFARKMMIKHVDEQDPLVERHYQNNRMLFASPLVLGLRRLTVPVGDNGPTVMSELEGARPNLDAGEVQLRDLATQFGGEVTDLGPVNALHLQALLPRVLRLVLRLEPGQHTPPYVEGNALAIYQVLDRKDPQPRPLEEVRSQVVEDYLTHYNADVFQEITNEMLAAAGFRLYQEHLTNMEVLTLSDRQGD